MDLTFIQKKMNFIEVSKNLAKYRFEKTENNL